MLGGSKSGCNGSRFCQGTRRCDIHDERVVSTVVEMRNVERWLFVETVCESVSVSNLVKYCTHDNMENRQDEAIFYAACSGMK